MVLCVGNGVKTVLTNERREKILEKLLKNGSVKAVELEKDFSVSGETIRRDLMVLEAHKKLIRVHGGAVSCRTRDIRCCQTQTRWLALARATL